MSDEETTPKLTGRSLTAEENSAVTDHINRKAAHPQDACSVCGSPLNLVAPSAYRLTVQADAEGRTNSMMPVYVTACLNCGYIRMFSERIVQQHIEDAAAAAAPEADGEKAANGD